MITDTRRVRTAARAGRRWPALFVVGLATFMDLIDVTIVNVALPTIQREFRAGYSMGQWLVAGYALAYAVSLISGGRLGDIKGRRKVFIVGVTGFTLASAVAGAAVGPELLIAARVVQGGFAGIMVPQAFALIATQFPPGRERTLAFSLYGALLGIAQFSGPVLGGLLTDLSPFGLGWRSIFFINIPIGLLALVGAMAWMGESRSDHESRLDLPGVLLVGAASLMIVFPLVEWHRFSWGGAAGPQGGGPGNGGPGALWIPLSVGAAIIVLAGFGWYERRRENRGAAPLVPTALFGLRSFTAGLVLLLVLFSGTAAYFIVLTWHLQFGLGWSATHVALTSVAWPAGIACTAQLTHRFGHRRGRVLVGAGTSIMCLSTVALASVVAADGAALSSAHIVPWMLISGVGMGMTIPILSNLVLGDVPVADAGAASGVLNSVIQVGGALGVAIAGVIFFAGRAVGSHPAGPLTGESVTGESVTGESIARDLVAGEFAAGATRALSYSAAVFLLAALLSPLLPRRARHGERLDPVGPAKPRM